MRSLCGGWYFGSSVFTNVETQYGKSDFNVAGLFGIVDKDFSTNKKRSKLFCCVFLLKFTSDPHPSEFSPIYNHHWL